MAQSFRFHEPKLPSVDEAVMCRVMAVDEISAYVQLLEYNVEGMVLISELSRRRMRSVQKHIKVGQTKVLVVIRVDADKDYIDLSKRRVTKEDTARCEERFSKSRTTHSILCQVSEKTGVALETLYQTVCWPLTQKYGHALDAFCLTITNPDIWDDVKSPSQAVTDELVAICKQRLTPQAVKVRTDIEVTCFGYEGIDAIKEALRAARDTTLTEDEGTEATPPISVRLVAPPLYVVSCNVIDKDFGLRLLQKAIEATTAKIHEYNGKCEVKMAPRAVTGHDDDTLKALMEERARENKEVSGDDDSGSDAEPNGI